MTERKRYQGEGGIYSPFSNKIDPSKYGSVDKNKKNTRYKKIDGKTYTYMESYQNPYWAEEQKKVLKKRGYSIRIIKNKDVYDLFYRLK